jgi:hypothetical protein
MVIYLSSGSDSTAETVAWKGLAASGGSWAEARARPPAPGSNRQRRVQSRKKRESSLVSRQKR